MIVVAVVAAGTAARFALSEIDVGLVFVTYYPAILICSVLTSWRYALLAAILSAVIAQSYFAPPQFGPHLATAIVNLTIFLISSGLIIAVGSNLRVTVRKLERARRSADILSTELRHRVKNTLTVVQALAYQSAKAPSTEEFLNSFTARLQALATAHDVMQRSNVETCSLPDIVDEACEPFSCPGTNIDKSGPACILPSRSCIPLMLLLHELCTNALKHGALSVPEGKVTVSWSFAMSGQRVVIEWEEIGGPPVSRQKRKGLGLSLMRAQPGIAEVRHRLEKTGVRCSIGIALNS